MALASHVGRSARDLLSRLVGCRDHQHLRAREHPRQAHLNVAGAWRQIDHQVIECPPLHILEEVLDGPVEHEAAPHDRFVLAREEAHRDDLQQAGSDRTLEGDHLARRAPRTAPSIAEQPRHGVAPDVRVEQSDDEPPPGERDREIHADRRLADTSLARSDGEDPRRGGDVGRRRPGPGP